MPVRTVSQKFIRSKGGKILWRIMEQTNKDCRFRNFDNFPTPTTFACWKIRFKTEVCTCSQFPTEAMRWIKEVEMVESVDDLKSSRSIREFLVQTLSYSTRKMLQHWTKSSIILTSRKRSVWRKNESSQRRPFPPRKTDRLPDPRVFPGHRSQRFCRELCRPIHYWSSKWWYSEIRFKVGWNFIVCDENPTWWHLGRIVQIKNTRVWEIQDRIRIVQYGDSSEESLTWLSQIEDDGEKKYRARFTKQEFWGQKRKLWKKRCG